MFYKESLKFYNKNIKFCSKDKFYLCRIELLFRYCVIPNIKKNNIRTTIKKRIKTTLYLSHLFLSIISIFAIIKLFFTKIKTAQYLIDINNSNNFYDFRSKEILNVIKPDNSANFMHINNIRYSMKSWHKKKNAIYFESIYYVLKPFLPKKRFEYTCKEITFIKDLLEIHQENYSDSYYIFFLVKLIFRLLNIKQCVFIDDSRYTNELNIAAKELDIKTIGYMHGRFNEYHIALFEFPFDKYYVWSDYFKQKILNNSIKYKDEDIIISGYPRLKKTYYIKNRGKNILWLGESNIDYNEIIPYIKNILKYEFKIIFRGKPGENNKLKKFLYKYNITIDCTETFFDSLSENDIGLVVGTHSTALMESWLAGIPSLALNSSYDYGSHLWEDGLIELCKFSDNIKYKIDYYLSSELDLNARIEKTKNKIWGENPIYDDELVIKEVLL